MTRLLLIFTTLVICTSAIPRETRQVKDDDPCLLPKEVGPCRGAKPMYYFDGNSGLCLPFAFGGCEGNGNKFKTREECTAACKSHIAQQVEEPSSEDETPIKRESDANQQVTESSSDESPESKQAVDQQQDPVEISEPADEEDICNQPPLLSELKRCRALLPRYHFNSSSGQCEFYIYNGCGGSKNLFSSEDECKNVCDKQGETKQSEVSGDVTTNIRCTLKREVGRCFAAIPRYAYDQDAGKCVRFIYGGCGGNDNNFLTLEDCEQTCGGSSSTTEAAGKQ